MSLSVRLVNDPTIKFYCIHFQLQKSKNQSERKEAEVRQELLALRQAMDGITAAEFNRMERELRDVKQQNAQLQIEAETSADKLLLYKRNLDLPTRRANPNANGFSSKYLISCWTLMQGCNLRDIELKHQSLGSTTSCKDLSENIVTIKTSNTLMMASMRRSLGLSFVSFEKPTQESASKLKKCVSSCLCGYFPDFQKYTLLLLAFRHMRC